MHAFDNKRAMQVIKSNIKEHGFHTYSVSHSNIPRYYYTIGLFDIEGKSELIFAGGYYFKLDAIKQVIQKCINHLEQTTFTHYNRFPVDGYGDFIIDQVDSSWVKFLCSGAIDFHKSKDVKFLQIIPTAKYKTTDIPDLSHPYDPNREPIWKWITETWNFSIPKNSSAIINLACLKGAKVTEGMRWEHDEWELFHGHMQDISKSDMRIIPMATMLAIDPSLESFTTIETETGLWRKNAQEEWHKWKAKN